MFWKRCDFFGFNFNSKFTAFLYHHFRGVSSSWFFPQGILAFWWAIFPHTASWLKSRKSTRLRLDLLIQVVRQIDVDFQQGVCRPGLLDWTDRAVAGTGCSSFRTRAKWRPGNTNFSAAWKKYCLSIIILETLQGITCMACFYYYVYINTVDNIM